MIYLLKIHCFAFLSVIQVSHKYIDEITSQQYMKMYGYKFVDKGGFDTMAWKASVKYSFRVSLKSLTRRKLDVR